jgi:hypothetical protein
MSEGTMRKYVNADAVGGPICADLLFQMAARDPSDRKDWGRIAHDARIADPRAAEKYYRDVTAPPRTFARWAPHEVKLIEEHLVAGGTQPNFSLLEVLLPGRTAKAIRTKCSDLKPPPPFSPDEDARLLALVHRHGRDWDAITAQMPNRSASLLKRRLGSLERR